MSLVRVLESVLKSRERKSQLRRLTVFDSETHIDFSSNDFLSLSKNADLFSSFQAEVANGPKLMGSGGSRLLDGNSKYVEQLETDIAKFHGASGGLLYNSGFDANVSIYSCIPQPKDIILFDEYIHASAHDGMRMSRKTERIMFEHNSVKSLEDRLENVCSIPEVMNGSRNIFIGVESVYSMDGDVAPLQEIVSSVKRYLPKGNGYIIVDEAHATGVIGPQGRGLVSKLGLEKDIFLRVHTFGKALSVSGGIVLCESSARQYLINYSRPFIYSTSLPQFALTAIRASYDFLQTKKAEELQIQLWDLIDYLHSRLRIIFGNPTNSTGLVIYEEVDCLHHNSSIFSLLCKESRKLALECQKNGFVVRPIVYPTVPLGKERVRICLHSENTKQEIERLLALITSWTVYSSTNSMKGNL